MPSPEERRPGRPEPVKGLDYIINYYAVLGLQNDATLPAIKKAFRNQIALYHEDKYAHLAPEFQEQAKFKTGVLIEANSILTDAESRREYDEKLATWEGQISDTGYPIRVVGLRRLNSRIFAPPSEEELASLDSVVEMGHTMSGHNPATFEFIRTQYLAAENPSPELVAAYRQALAQQDMDLALEESFRREFAGLDKDAAVTSSPERQYLEAAKADIDDGRELLTTGVQRALFMLQSGEIRAIEAGLDQGFADDVATDPDRALAVHTQQVLEAYTRDTAEIERLAELRQAVMEERLKLVRGEYIPEQTELFDKVVVCRQIGDNKIWYITERTGNNVNIIEQEGDMQQALNTREKIQEMLSSGHNVMYVVHHEGLPLDAEITEAVINHYLQLDKANQEQT